MGNCNTFEAMLNEIKKTHNSCHLPINIFAIYQFPLRPTNEDTDAEDKAPYYYNI